MIIITSINTISLTKGTNKCIEIIKMKFKHQMYNNFK